MIGSRFLDLACISVEDDCGSSLMIEFLSSSLSKQILNKSSISRGKFSDIDNRYLGSPKKQNKSIFYLHN